MTKSKIKVHTPYLGIRGVHLGSIGKDSKTSLSAGVKTPLWMGWASFKDCSTADNLKAYIRIL